MGCWNGTCMVSGLPIVHGDPIVALVIRESVNGTWGSNCYCYAEANLASHFIFGEYNDYGGIENIQPDEDNERLFDFLKKELIPSKGHDLGVDTDNEFHFFKTPNTLQEALNDCIGRGYAGLKTTCLEHNKIEGKVQVVFAFKPAPVTLTFIHKEIWDHIKEFCQSYHDYDEKTFATLIEEEIDKWRKDNYFIERSPLSKWSGWCGIKPDDISDENILNIMMLVSYLEHHRMNLRPTTGNGCQMSDYESHIKLYEKSIEIAQAKIKEWKE